MTILEKNSQIFKNSVLNLYNKGLYNADFSIQKAEELYTRNRIIEKDYIEILDYLAEKQEKEMQEEVVEETVLENEIQEENSTTETIEEASDTKDVVLENETEENNSTETEVE